MPTFYRRRDDARPPEMEPPCLPAPQPPHVLPWPPSPSLARAAPGGRRTRRLVGVLGGLVVTVLLNLCSTTWAQRPAPSPDSQPLSARLSFFRWLEDYSTAPEVQLEDNIFTRVKRLPLSDSPTYPYLSLGGNYRLRYEHASNQVFGLFGPEDSDVILHRFLVHGDLQVAPTLRAFVQLGVYEEMGRPGGPRPADESRVDLQQAFLDIKLAALQLRIGRQELSVGTGLHTDVREGPNQRLAFDAVRATIFLGKPSSVDVFYGQEVGLDQRAFRDSPADGARLWGLYGSKLLPLGESAFVDLYYLGLHREEAVYEQGKGEEVRHTLGLRLAGNAGAWAYEVESLFQFGSFRGQDIRAWGVLTGNYYTVTALPWQPRLGLRANAASGDGDPHDGVLGTFDPLFPNPSYLTEAALYYPRNLYELHPMLFLTPHKTVQVSLGFNWLWRFSRDDAVYTLPGVPLVPSRVSQARYTGSLFDFVLQWAPSPHLLLKLSYVHATAGDALRDAKGVATDFLMTSMDLRF